MKKRKVAIYDPYLDTLGGGELYLLFIVKHLQTKGYHVDIFWNHDLSADIKQAFGIDLHNISFKPNVFKSKGKLLKKLDMLRAYDYFFYITDGSFFFSSAKKNFIIAMVPDKKLYTHSFVNRIKTFNYHYISISEFTNSYLKTLGIQGSVCYPPLNQSFLSLQGSQLKKQRFILSVGRFFSHLHSKRHDIAIEAFQKLQQNKRFKDYKLIIAGGLKKEDKGYFQMLQKKANNNESIVFKPNIESKDLLQLYKQASFYWHCAGFGQDETKNPEKVEHLGISPIEAMASGAIPFCYRAGGPKELIIEGKTGFLFRSIDELISKTTQAEKDDKKQMQLRVNGHIFVEQHFSISAFEKRLSQII